MKETIMISSSVVDVYLMISGVL